MNNRYDRYAEAFYEAERLERMAKKVAAEAEKARLKEHGLVRTVVHRRSRMWGSSAPFTHSCPKCGKFAAMHAFAAVCTGKRIRKLEEK